MSGDEIFRVTEPRLDTVKHKGFHWFRVFWLGSYAIWLVFFSTQNSELTRALITALLLLGIWAGWAFAKRWSEEALVLELTPSHVRFSFRASQRLQVIELSRVQQLRYHRHLLIFDGDNFSIQAFFPVKHRQYVARIRTSLEQTHPQITQIPA